jgi:cell division protein FtsW
MCLCLVSLVEVYSATSTLAYRKAYFWTPIMEHTRHLLIGFAVVFALHNIPSKYYSWPVILILLPVSIILLFVTPFVGVSVNGAHRWLSLMGSVPFQPSEFAKFTCIVFVAFMLSKQERFTPTKTFWIMLGGVVLICALILPENLSTSVLLYFVCYLMMIVGQAPSKILVWLSVLSLLLAGALIVSLLFMSKDNVEKHLPRFVTWKARIDDFCKDESENKYVINEADGDNFQVNHAKIAIARGGILGNLPGRSVQRDILPQAYSDFIYAIIIEELGLVFGGCGVLMLYVFLLFRVAVIARRCEKLFPKYLTLGCGLLIVIQAFINMAVAVNMMPVTGQPLPLISRGGTSIVFTCFYFGIILSVSRFGADMGDGEDDEKEEENGNNRDVEKVVPEEDKQIIEPEVIHE